MKNKGFTLIELLAIIVILAIIAVITVPQIANVIEDSRKNSTKDSAYGYKNAVHQYYLTNSTNDDEFDLNGSYDVINGAIVSRGNTYNISTNGEAPKSGNVTIEDGEIVDGCIDYGKYSVVIENGEVTEASAGACYNVSYFTYDENAESDDDFGLITSKLSSPNSSWPYYIKEMESPNKYLYSIWDIEENEFYYGHPLFSTLESCNEIVKNDMGDENHEYFECRVFKNRSIYQVCYVDDGTTTCFKPGLDNYDYNYNVMSNTFDNCSMQNYNYACDSARLSSYDGDISIGNCEVIKSSTEDDVDFYSAKCLTNMGSVK